MPKAKFREGRGSRAEARTYKFKLGNRKSSTAAHTVSSDELIKMYFSGNAPKNKAKIAAVLKLRNVELALPVIEEEQTEA